MRIAIDYTPAIAQSAGIGRYARNLVAALAAVDDTDQFTLFSSEPPLPERGFPKAENMHPRVIGLGNRRMTIVWHRLRMPLPAELLTGPADIWHGPDFVLPPLLRTRRIVTIHDLAFLTHPECALPSLVRYLSQTVPRSLRAADQIIAVSQRTADDLVQRMGVPRERISVVYLGIDTSLTAPASPEALAAIRAKYDLKPPIALAVGTIEPRKNYERLIKAFAQATRQPDGPRTLVIVGHKGWLYDGVFAAAAASENAERVRLLDNIADGELRLLYQTADLLATPSIYEGFGIPVVEAMASGTPVVCSDGGSLPEIAGDAALIVSPEDVDGLAQALVRLTSDAALRETLIARGRERATMFNWEDAARAHVAIYHKLGHK